MPWNVSTPSFIFNPPPLTNSNTEVLWARLVGDTNNTQLSYGASVKFLDSAEIAWLCCRRYWVSYYRIRVLCVCVAQVLAQYYLCLQVYRRAYTLATQNIPMDWSFFTTFSSRYASLCKVLSRIPLWYSTCPFPFRGVLAARVINFATLRSRREVPWSGCWRLTLPIPFLLLSQSSPLWFVR